MGIQITGARIVGDIDLENAKLIRSISILDSRIEGPINMIRARTDSLISLAGSVMSGRLDADGLHSESDLFLTHGVFKSEINLNGAKIDGDVVSPEPGSTASWMRARCISAAICSWIPTTRTRPSSAKWTSPMRRSRDNSTCSAPASMVP